MIPNNVPHTHDRLFYVYSLLIMQIKNILRTRDCVFLIMSQGKSSAAKCKSQHMSPDIKFPTMWCVCPEHRLRSAGAYAQSYQSLC